MWMRAQELLEETQRVRQRFFALVADEPLASWEPPADLFDTPAGLWVTVALPGVEPRQIAVHCDGNRVHVTAHRDAPALLRGARILRMELPHGRFEREIELPPGVYRVVEQALDHGCLVLRLIRGGTR
jgi:HSP20 family protein